MADQYYELKDQKTRPKSDCAVDDYTLDTAGTTQDHISHVYKTYRLMVYILSSPDTV